MGNKPEVIEAYLKIKSSKTDEEALRRYVAEHGDEEKEKVEKLRRERRRLQEQLRRNKKNKEKLHNNEKLNKQLSKTEVWDTDDEDAYDNDGLVKVEDTKIYFKKKLLKDNKKRKRMSSDDLSEHNPGFYAALDQGIEIR